MQEEFSQIDTFNLVITTAILVAFGGLLVFFLFQYQRKRYDHTREMLELREAFNKSLLQSKLEIQEQTLGHIARELHDNISPLISIIQINLGTPKLKKITDIQVEISDLKANAGQLMTELKSLSITLNTDYIMSCGFADALWQELDRLERTRQYKTIRTETGEKFRLRPEHEIMLFRMCQEILNNIIKHANAKTITVQIDYNPGKFQVNITDDGIGFDPGYTQSHSAEKASTGLLNIQSRAKLINAQFTINSKLQKGTIATITIIIN
jgi:signal transduction histidine kinase